MSGINFSESFKHSVSSDEISMKLYLDLLKNEAKPEGISKAVYLAYLSIQVLEKKGNYFPSQEEIDVVEGIIKHFNKSKLVKLTFRNSCQTTAPYKVMSAVA